MKKHLFSFVSSYEQYANSLLLQGSSKNQRYLFNKVAFEHSSNIQFSRPKEWTTEKKLEQLSKYQKQPQIQTENIEEFVRNFSNDSFRTPSQKPRSKRSYTTKNKVKKEDNVSFEVKGAENGVCCCLSNISGVINLSKEFE
ncbi:Hypothetical_protein [Hexamita inflata]|uniref:Hypothetical_protein n=1 Tax=Hexamita inflata TaxID=28002 RepID=A0AA86Q1V6_9EUKA|nr:Hypothetical protein HINF_LOCUS32497 [Hexamita inflata]